MWRPTARIDPSNRASCCTGPRERTRVASNPATGATYTYARQASFDPASYPPNGTPYSGQTSPAKRLDIRSVTVYSLRYQKLAVLNGEFVYTCRSRGHLTRWPDGVRQMWIVDGEPVQPRTEVAANVALAALTRTVDPCTTPGAKGPPFVVRRPINIFNSRSFRRKERSCAKSGACRCIRKHACFLACGCLRLLLPRRETQSGNPGLGLASVVG
jgi:hypothetical protein